MHFSVDSASTSLAASGQRREKQQSPKQDLGAH